MFLGFVFSLCFVIVLVFCCVGIGVFFTWDDVVRICREVSQFPRDFVSDELRGWCWSRPPVLFTGCVRLGVCDVVSEFCSSGRDVFLRHVLKVKGRVSERLFVGYLVHVAFSELVTCAKKVLYSGGIERGVDLVEVLKSEGRKVLVRILEQEECPVSRDFAESVFWSVWTQGMTVYAGMFDKVRKGRSVQYLDSTVLQVVPLNVEVSIDGSLVGLGNVRVDAVLYPNIPVEIKLGDSTRGEVALAGYALAMESMLAQPIDFGILVNVKVSKDGEVSWNWKLVPITDELRLEFLHERDRKADIVEKQLDPGLAEHCPRACPYYEYCHGEKAREREEMKAQEKPVKKARVRIR